MELLPGVEWDRAEHLIVSGYPCLNTTNGVSVDCEHGGMDEVRYMCLANYGNEDVLNVFCARS